MDMITHDQILLQFSTPRIIKSSNKSANLLMKNEKKGFSLRKESINPKSKESINPYLFTLLTMFKILNYLTKHFCVSSQMITQ